MIIKNAQIECWYNIWEKRSEYILMLSQKQFIDFELKGLNPKKNVIADADEERYWIRINPVLKGKGWRNYSDAKIFEYMKEYIHEKDVELTLDVFSKEVNDRVIVKLYFDVEHGIKIKQEA